MMLLVHCRSNAFMHYNKTPHVAALPLRPSTPISAAPYSSTRGFQTSISVLKDAKINNVLRTVKGEKCIDTNNNLTYLGNRLVVPYPSKSAKQDQRLRSIQSNVHKFIPFCVSDHPGMGQVLKSN